MTIVQAEGLRLIFPSTVVRALTTAVKKSVLMYFESTRYIHNIRCDVFLFTASYRIARFAL